MEVAIEELNRLIDERNLLTKQLNIVIFAKLFACVTAMAKAFNVDLQESVSLFNIDRTETAYVFTIFLHEPNTKKEDTQGEQLLIDIPIDIAKTNNEDTILAYMRDRMFEEMAEGPTNNRTLH